MQKMCPINVVQYIISNAADKPDNNNPAMDPSSMLSEMSLWIIKLEPVSVEWSFGYADYYLSYGSLGCIWRSGLPYQL